MLITIINNNIHYGGLKWLELNTMKKALSLS